MISYPNCNAPIEPIHYMESCPVRVCGFIMYDKCPTCGAILTTWDECFKCGQKILYYKPVLKSKVGKDMINLSKDTGDKTNGKAE